MGRVVISSSDRQAWLAARRDYVTASDVAAMLGESREIKGEPLKTREQLMMEKLGLAEEWQGDENTDIWLALEAPIAEIARARWGWQLQHHGGLVVDAECPRLAATPDYVMPSPWGMVNVQIKGTGCAATEDTNPVTKSGKPSTAAFAFGAPLYHELQVQAEMAVLGYEHSVLLVMHTTPFMKLRPYYVGRHESVIQRIRAETVRFWDELEVVRREGKVAV